DRRTARDTIWIDFPVFDGHIRAQWEEDALEGYWVLRNRPDYQIRFKALHGQHYRFFQTPAEPVADISGRWLCRFGIDSDKIDTLICVFILHGNALTGTFLSRTGDSRFLEGSVSGDRMFLSVFDGTHAYLYEAKILPDGQLSGIYRSGTHYKTYWDAVRTEIQSVAELADPYALTQMKVDGPFTLTLPNPDGIPVSIHEPP